MSLKKKYRFTIEDESSLQKKVDISAHFSTILMLITGVIILCCIIGMLIMAYSPMKRFLPGYLKASERTATEEQHLRLDSLIKIYEVNEAYLKSVINALNPPQISFREEDTISRRPQPIKIDSLLPISTEEKNFMERIREREKYNIPYATTAAAQIMMFGPINNSAVISESSKDSYQVEIIVPENAPISTVAEGVVISMSSSPRYSGAFEVIIQHPKGFLSKISRLSNLTVRPGDRVASGQIIATAATKNGMKGNHILFELWHDGNPLIPTHYIQKGYQSQN